MEQPDPFGEHIFSSLVAHFRLKLVHPVLYSIVILCVVTSICLYLCLFRPRYILRPLNCVSSNMRIAVIRRIVQN